MSQEDALKQLLFLNFVKEAKKDVAGFGHFCYYLFYGLERHILLSEKGGHTQILYPG